MRLTKNHIRRKLFRFSLLVFTFLLSQSGLSQNLVYNGDFEYYNHLPYSVGNWFMCIGWSNTNTDIWMTSPDYMHTDGSGMAQMPNTNFATVHPYSGSAVMGFGTYSIFQDYREYISTELIAPLVVGESYIISFWLTNGESNIICGYGTNHIGVKFSKSPLTQHNTGPIHVLPQLEISTVVWSTRWEQHTLTFVADSAYQYMTIGNFYNDAHTAFAYQIPSIYAEAYYFIDQVKVVPTNPPAFEMPNLITPNGDGRNDQFVPLISRSIKSVHTTIYNEWGSKVYETDQLTVDWDAEGASDGVYYWMIQYEDFYGGDEEITGILTVMR